MINLNPQIIRKDGVEEYVVLPWREFQELKELLEDAADLLELDRAREQAKGEPAVPLSDVLKRFGISEESE